MKYSIVYSHTGFAIIEAENEADAAEQFNHMTIGQIEEYSEGDTLFINSIYKAEEDE